MPLLETLEVVSVSAGNVGTSGSKSWDGTLWSSGSAAPALAAPPGPAPGGSPQSYPYVPAARRASSSQRLIAGVISFIAAAVALLAINSYVNELSRTLASVRNENQKVIKQLGAANKGLDGLDRKTAKVADLNRDAKQLKKLMGTIDSDMGGMLGGVDRINAGMTQMSGTLDTLDGEITQVGAYNSSIAGKLDSINKGLAGQKETIATLRKDVDATSGALEQLPPQLKTTNARLGHVNRFVCLLGKTGITNKLKLAITFIGIPNGSAVINATMIPPGGWTC